MNTLTQVRHNADFSEYTALAVTTDGRTFNVKGSSKEDLVNVARAELMAMDLNAACGADEAEALLFGSTAYIVSKVTS